MEIARQKVEKLKALVHDLPEDRDRKTCLNFIKRNFTPSDNLREDYVNRKFFELRDKIHHNNGLREALSVLAAPSKKENSILKKLIPFLPFFKAAAIFILGLLTSTGK